MREEEIMEPVQSGKQIKQRNHLAWANPLKEAPIVS